MSQFETTENTNQSDSSNSKGEGKENKVSKQAYRKKVWDYLEKNKLTNFPRPVYGRIPNFKGSEEAAAKLLELDEFKNVKNVEVNPDKPQEFARMLVLEKQKNLYVPVPRLKEGLLKYITVPEGSTINDIRNAVNRRGLEFNGQNIGINDEVNIDLLVLGSVAVSKEGYRIGKGRGYADLEFALLLEMGAVTDKTIVVTTVHDSQVYDVLPKEIFQPYDVPVDYILTPTQIIKVQKQLPRPKGIIWNILSQRRLNLMPVLKALKEIHESKNIDTTLKELDTDNEAYESRPRFNRYSKFRRRHPQSDTKNSESQGEDVSNNENVRPRRFQRRRFFRRHKIMKSQDKPSENGDTNAGENNTPKPTPPPIRRNAHGIRQQFRRNKRQIDFSLMVTNIEKNVRVRDLKNALIERGIKPNDITWRGYKGFCYLHYAKPNEKGSRVNSEEKGPIIVDNVIEILQNLKIGPDSDSNLCVKILEPISRIETTNVTAV